MPGDHEEPEMAIVELSPASVEARNNSLRNQQRDTWGIGTVTLRYRVSEKTARSLEGYALDCVAGRRGSQKG